ncbi:MAG: ketopantoate reductase family protein [Alphaproteobacteria bacterium]
MNEKIAVLSTGANGSCIAADLTAAGLDVTMIDHWPAHVEAMRAKGVTIETRDGTTITPVNAIHLCDVATLTAPFDIVLLTSKAYDTRWLTELIRPHLATDGLLVAVQNCMTAEMIAEMVGPERTVGCVVELSSQLFEPAEIKRNTETARTWFGVGAFDPAHADRVIEVAELLSHAGRVDISEDVISAKWMKLITNTMSMGIKAICNTTNAQLFQENDPDYAAMARAICLKSGEEALAAGQFLGYKPVPVYGLKQEDVENTNNLLETLLDKIVADVGPTAINTVLQDHMKGRYSEVDMINGMVADECRANGRPSPVNDAVVEITRRIHAGELSPDIDNLDLLRREITP